MDIKVAIEVVEADFARMCASNRVATDLAEMSDIEKADLTRLKSKIIPAMKRGQLVVSEAGAPVFTPPGGQPLTFKQATGATWIAFDGDSGLHSKFFGAICDLTGIQRVEIARMHAHDYQVCKAITELFL